MGLQTRPRSRRDASAQRESLIDFSAESGAVQEKKSRHRMTDFQLERLEALFQRTTHPNRLEKQVLSNEVGMSFKSVTIWFQNKRQTSRRKKPTDAPLSSAVAGTLCADTSSVNPASASVPGSQASNVARPPLATVHQGSNAGAAPVTVTNPAGVSGGISMKSGQALQSKPNFPVEQAPASQLWTYLLSSPPLTPGKGALHAQRTPPASPTPTRVPRQRPMLDWVCAREQKRRRLDSDAADAEEECQPPSTPGTDVGAAHADGLENVSVVTVPSQGPRRIVRLVGAPEGRERKPMKKSNRHISALAIPGSAPQAARVQIPIPSEYSALFSPDIIFGASLLLTLKHSMDAEAV